MVNKRQEEKHGASFDGSQTRGDDATTPEFNALLDHLLQVDPKQLPPVPPMPLNPKEVKEDSVTGVTNVSPKNTTEKAKKKPPK